MKKITPDTESLETGIDETTPEVAEEMLEPEAIADGRDLVYAREDAGRNLPHLGLALEPGYIYVVGEDFDGAFARRLIETGTCSLHEPAVDKVETDKKVEMPAPEPVKEPKAVSEPAKEEPAQAMPPSASTAPEGRRDASRGEAPEAEIESPAVQGEDDGHTS